ncbi:hypothetical protein P2G88_17725 [Aliiglaciecola sp. CAU 1673]|uniref:hypothetical protein n=1 Tax=Aliiglaciecola sp. CAU 1673 TaxID=3032595 RepID=UPI0023DB49D7|nr:hypothetical protein [Aliiglaciecola sp. CAU 1673]MDF2180098.1 hypothetical protein [Aliiglaciecola sp. CAU 1673]
MAGFTSCVIAKQPSPLLISYIEHPTASFLNQLLKDAYAELGLQLQFEPMPFERGRLMAIRGEVDGLAARVGPIAADLPNMIKVKVPLLKISIHLICSPQAACDNQVLEDPATTVAVPSGNNHADVIMKEHRAKTLDMKDLQQIMAMLANGRLSYGLFVIADRHDPQLGSIQIAQPPLETQVVYHYLHVKHMALLPDLEKSLAKVVAAADSVDR